MNVSDFVCGLCAGWTQVIVGQPFDFIKVRIQTGVTWLSEWAIIKDIYNSYGARGFYRGSSSMFVGYSAIIGT
jgi:solute carrier family 25 (mitochondrial carnitine/acylcarnitine transporter), member 20/29